MYFLQINIAEILIINIKLHTVHKSKLKVIHISYASQWFAPNCAEAIPVPMTLGWQWRVPAMSCSQWHRRNKLHSAWQQAQGQNKQMPFKMDGNKRGSSEWMNEWINNKNQNPPYQYLLNQTPSRHVHSILWDEAFCRIPKKGRY